MTNATPPIDESKLIPKTLSSNIELFHFDCDDDDLNSFLKDDALDHQERNLAHTTCVLYHDKVIGYYSLVCDSIQLEMKERFTIFHREKKYQYYPAVKIARMALDKNYQYKRLGSLFISIIIGMVWSLNKRAIACRFITVDAYLKAVEFYSKNGFEKNLAYAKKQSHTVSMRRDIFNYPSSRAG